MSFRVSAAATWLNFARVFWHTCRPFSSDMGVSRFRIKFRTRRGRKYLFSIGSGFGTAVTVVGFFSATFLLLIRRGLMQLGLGFPGMRSFNALPESSWAVRAGTHGILLSVGFFLAEK